MLGSRAPEEIPAIAAAAGASGILVDWIATPVTQRSVWSNAYTEALGEPLRSSDGRYSYWSLDAVPAADVDAVSPEVLAGLLQGREWSP